MGMVKVYQSDLDYQEELRRMTKRLLDLIQENQQLEQKVKLLTQRLAAQSSGSSRSST